MQRLAVRPGVLLESVGEQWAAFSPASGETHLLNDEAAAFLEVLQEAPLAVPEAAAVLSGDSGVPLATVALLLEDLAVELDVAGLIWNVPSQTTGDQAASLVAPT